MSIGLDTNMRSLFTPDYYSILSGIADTPQGACLDDYLNKLVNASEENINSIVLYGGLVRDGHPIGVWSDIDVAIIFKDIMQRDARLLHCLQREAQLEYSVRLDVTQVSLDELTRPHLVQNCMNSEILNALAMRDGVSTLVYGYPLCVTVTPEQEKRAAIGYISSTLFAFRRFLIEIVPWDLPPSERIEVVPRIVRWLFSIIRASLRLFGVYCHPYEPSIEHIKTVFPSIDISFPEYLLTVRRDYPCISVDDTFFTQAECFLTEFVSKILEENHVR